MSELVVAESKGLSREIRTKVTLFPSGLFPVGPVEPVVCDALIGMDVITLGDMGLTNLQNTRFMFRIPAKGNVPIGA